MNQLLNTLSRRIVRALAPRGMLMPGSHLGLAFNPLVLRVIARTLAGQSGG